MAAAGMLGVGASACTSAADRTSRRRTPVTVLPQHGDAALALAALADEEALLEYCSAVVASHPALTGLVTPVQQRQRQHIDTLRLSLRNVDVPPSRHAVSVPARARSAQAKLSRLAASARHQRFEDCLAAQSGRLARLLASASASHAVTVDLLGTSR